MKYKDAKQRKSAEKKIVLEVVAIYITFIITMVIYCITLLPNGNGFFIDKVEHLIYTQERIIIDLNNNQIYGADMSSESASFFDKEYDSDNVLLINTLGNKTCTLNIQSRVHGHGEGGYYDSGWSDAESIKVHNGSLYDIRGTLVQEEENERGPLITIKGIGSKGVLLHIRYYEHTEMVKLRYGSELEIYRGFGGHDSHAGFYKIRFIKD